MKTYQSVLPAATRKDCERNRTRLFRAAREMKIKVEGMLGDGFWFCYHCEARTERVEGEQGQPAHCGTCRSVRIEWVAPVAAPTVGAS